MWSKMDIGVHVKCRLFLSYFNETWIFCTYFSKNSQISNFMKVRPVGAALFQADGRTDGQRDDEAKGRFAMFANAPTNGTDSRWLHVSWISDTAVCCCIKANFIFGGGGDFLGNQLKFLTWEVMRY
jgi:hypothetical protein